MTDVHAAVVAIGPQHEPPTVRRWAKDQTWAEIGALTAATIIILGLFISAGVFMWKMIFSTADEWKNELHAHIQAIIGLQAAAAVAFALVVFLRQTDGPIKFKALGFEFDGASGQVAMWVVCFLAIAAAVKMCW